jgi:hypothetical protein
LPGSGISQIEGVTYRPALRIAFERCEKRKAAG